MCGIAGIISKKQMDVSGKLMEMLELIQHRGMDATGIAVYNKAVSLEQAVDLRVAITDESKLPVLLELIAQHGQLVTHESSSKRPGFMFTDATIKIDADQIVALHSAINRQAGLYVHSLGKGFKVYKDGGTTETLKDNHKLDVGMATHGMGHVRMATESTEDINAAHPFVSPFYPELSIVHNGQFTNYFNMRRFLENKGAIFCTMNDSEAASHFIAWAMRENGGDLEAALALALEELDGIFCIIAATSSQVGFVKDKLGIKPLLLLEDEDTILFGSEQIEFTVFYPDAYADEMEPGEMRVWNL